MFLLGFVSGVVFTLLACVGLLWWMMQGRDLDER